MRILTYNTRGSLGMDGLRSTRRIIDLVRGLTPDIVCFQEIHQRLPWSGREDQPAVLQVGLARPFYFQRHLRFGMGGYGIGVSTRLNVVLKKTHLLPSGKEQRGAQEIGLRNVPDVGSLTLFNTHWGLTEEERLQQAEALAQAAGNCSGPVIICGDFNEAISEPALSLLCERTGLLDADADCQRTTYPSDTPISRIDYILYSPDLRPVNVEVIESQASDHLPLLVDFVRA